jgi:hypothetical protein
MPLESTSHSTAAVSRFESAATLVVALIIGTLLPTSTSAQTIGFVYGLTRSSYSPVPNSLYGVAVDATGHLTPLPGFPIPTGGNGTGLNPEVMHYDAAGRRLYALNDASNTISVWSVSNTTGSLTPLPYSPITLPVRYLTGCIAVNPTGTILAIGDQGNNRIFSYRISATTAEPVQGSPFSTGSAEPDSCTFSQDGAFLYAAGDAGQCCTELAGFSVDPNTGVLMSLSGSPFAVGLIPMGLQTDHDGRLFASGFVPNNLDARVMAFTTAGGIPAAVRGSPFANGQLAAYHGLLHPAGFYLTTAWSSVGVFRIAGSGADTTLTAVSGSPFGSGGSSMAGSSTSVLDDSGRFVVTSNADNRNLTTFAFDPATGALTQLETSPTGAQGATGITDGLAFAPVGGSITGVVRDATSGVPLANARVSTLPGGFSTTTDAAGNYGLIVPSGTYTLAAAALAHKIMSVASLAVQGEKTITQDLALPPGAADGDFDGDGKTDITVIRPATATWYSFLSGDTTYSAHTWGISSDVAVPGDYDGDGKTDLAVFRPSSGAWYVLQSSTDDRSYSAQFWGINTDVPVPGDYDGDGITDLAVFRPFAATWYILQSSTNNTTYLALPLGVASDVPVPGDYDGDGKTDLAVFRPSDGTWHILQSSTNYTSSATQAWGFSTDVPVPGDYDGDGKTDVAVFRPSTGTWYILQSSTNNASYIALSWGSNADIPIRGDYDGDGKTDLALFRPSTGTWHVLFSEKNFTTSDTQFWSLSTDTPALEQHR